MALYEDSFVLRNQGEEPPEGYVLKGQMGPVGQEQDYYERPKSPTVGQPETGQMPAGGNINQFLDWAVKNKLGFNPFTMNPTEDALRKWNENESKFFQMTFGGSMTPSSMTPDALKHWNEQKKQGMAVFIQEAEQRQRNGIAYLNMLKEGWDAQQKQSEDRRTVREWIKIGGKETAINRFGEVIQDPNQPQGQQMPQQMGQSQVTPPSMGQPQEQSQFPGALTREGKPKEAKALSTEAITNIANMKSTYDRLDDIGKQVQAMEDKFGPVKGRMQEWSLKFKSDPEMQQLINRLRSLITIAYDLSGKQISKEEMVMLQKAMLPSATQPKGNMLATISFVRDWLAIAHNNRVQYFGKGKYDVADFPMLERGKNYNVDPKQVQAMKKLFMGAGTDKEGLSPEERLMNDDTWDKLGKMGEETKKKYKVLEVK